MGESKHQLWAVGLSFGIISFIATVLRVYTRTRIIRSFGIDDVLIVVAELLAVVFLVFMLVSTVNGLGRHIEDIPIENLFRVIQGNWGSSATYTLQVMSAKLSLLFFYLRIGGPQGSGLPTWFRISTYLLIVLTILVGVISETIIIFQCKPFDYQWNQVVPGTEGRCWDLVVFYFINAAMNIFLDICITILPMPVLMGLELPRRQKIGLCGVFALGGFVCIISVVRVGQLPALNKSTDITWDVTDAIVWYYIESTLIVVAACGSALKPLIRLYAPRLLGFSRNNHGSSPGYDAKGYGRSFIDDHNLYPLPRGHRASTHITSLSSTGGNPYGECDSEERIIKEGMGMGIIKTTDVVMTIENQGESHFSHSQDTRPETSGVEVPSVLHLNR